MFEGREGWPPGPWDDEPDRLDFWESGFSCRLVRGGFGAWCGYISVPKKHPWYGRSCSQLDALHSDVLQVHGGVTYASANAPAFGEGEAPRFWWIGFDAGHAFDIAPGLLALGLEPFPDCEPFHSGYRDVAYMQAETIGLARQAKEAARLAEAQAPWAPWVPWAPKRN